jgi:cupin 2 domain-containing protein
MANLLNDLPSNLPDELVTVLAENLHVRIERIVSTGQSSPGDVWYDQEEHEWVVVLKGESKLMFEDDAEPIHMKPGDCINISAQRRHRVEWTTPNEPTVWLAVFYQGDESECTAKENKR